VINESGNSETDTRGRIGCSLGFSSVITQNWQFIKVIIPLTKLKAYMNISYHSCIMHKCKNLITNGRSQNT